MKQFREIYYSVDTKRPPRIERLIAAAVVFFLALSGACIVSANAEDELLTFEDIKKISPSAKDDLARSLTEASPKLIESGINSPIRMAHFISQVMAETKGLTRLDEDLYYRYETILRVFSRETISEPKARELARKPKEMANWVYGHRLGNLGRHTDDGWNYRGSGHIQLTGRTNFRLRGADRDVDQPFEQNPDLARQSPGGIKAAISYWKANDINSAADDNDIRRVRLLVNGPRAHGLDVAQIWFSKAWRKVFQNKSGVGAETSAIEAQVVDENLLFEELLTSRGIVPPSLPNTEAGNATRVDAIKSFQRELGLPETGILDDATRLELLDPREWRYRDEWDLETLTNPADPESSVTYSIDNDRDTSPPTSVELKPYEGTGEIIENPTMPDKIANALENASAIYAPYEMGELRLTPERFLPFSVVGDDDRVVVPNTTTYPERAIVQIIFDNGTGTSLCTGAMVSADTVLTAAHCVHSGTTTGRSYSNFRVIPGRNLGATPFGECWAVKTYVLRGWVQALNSLDTRSYDLGALKLNCKIGASTGWFGVRTISDADLSTNTVVQGYAADRAPPGRQWRSTDKLRFLWELKGFYQNDTYGGTSGSPVFFGNDRTTIVGVHTNGLHGEEPWKSNNAFTRITVERLSRISQWIAD